MSEKQKIKTIWMPITESKAFDRRVNAAIHDGWCLLSNYPIVSTAAEEPLLYAELRKGGPAPLVGLGFLNDGEK